MKSYIKFMLLGTSLLAADLYAGGSENSTNSQKEEQTEDEKVSVEELIGIVQGLHKVIEDANNGSKEAQDQVAMTFKKYPQLLYSDALIQEIEISKWQNLDKRIQKNFDLLPLILHTVLSEKVDENVRIKIFNILNKKYNIKKTTAEEIRLLGTCYSKGEGVPQDKKKAFELYEQAAKLGHAGAMFNLGIMYKNGQGVMQNQEKSIKFYEQAAKLGYADAMLNLGSMYCSGEGVPQDYKMAMNLYEKAAVLGNTNAIYNLGVFYERGRSVPQNYKIAVQYYKKAAELGNSNALANLGFCYANGEGVLQDYKMAVKLYKQAIELGSVVAMVNLGVCYAKGEGVPQDYKMAMNLYEKAAGLGCIVAMVNLGHYYAKGWGVIQDYKMAVKLYKQAIESGGHPDAMYNLGVCYAKGWGVPQDYKMAVKLYKQAIELGGHPYAFFGLATHYGLGHGVPQDYKVAFDFCKQATELGHANSMYQLGNHYEHGLGTTKNSIKALEYYLSALDSKHKSDAMPRIKILLFFTPTKADFWKFEDVLEEVGLVAPSNVQKGEELSYDLGNLLEFHEIQKIMNDENYSFDRKGVTPSKDKYALYNMTSYGAEALVELLSTTTSNHFVMPCGFMLTNVKPSEDLLLQYAKDQSVSLKDSVFSISKFGSYEFYNIGHDAVSLASVFDYFTKNLPLAKQTLGKLIELEKDPELLEHLKTHKQFADSLDENLGYALSKSSGPRNDEFKNHIGF